MKKRSIVFLCMWAFLLNVSSFGGLKAPEMVLVEAGTFQMGDEVGDLWYGCSPVHEVVLTYDFLIGIYEVTFAEYDAFCMATGRVKPKDQGWGRGDQPVILVSWHDAIAFCNWLSVEHGLAIAYDPSGNLLDKDDEITTDITKVEGFRLPTEAEWEYAASGGHRALPIPPRFLFAGSDDLDEVGWYSENSGEYHYTGTGLGMDYGTHGSSGIEGKSAKPVGLLKPNELGIYDMSGNLWEWCHDWYGSYSPERKINPTGASSSHVRVIRGGSWIFGEKDCRIAGRFYRTPMDRIFRLGFRIARTVVH